MRFELPFFYGNVSTLWRLLSDAFPEKLPKPLTMQKILNFLHKSKIAVSDTIVKCERTSSSAFDRDLIPIDLNTRIVKDIENSNITEVLFTSGFGKHSAFRLFYSNILGKRLSNDIIQKREVKLNAGDVFGRPVLLKVLYSPSGAANVGISRSKAYLQNKHKYAHTKRPVYHFKVDHYREMFALE